MRRREIFDMLATLKLAGMRAAFDDVLTHGITRQHPAEHIIDDPLAAEIAEKHAPPRMRTRAVGAARWVLPAPAPPVSTADRARGLGIVECGFRYAAPAISRTSRDGEILRAHGVSPT